MRILNLYYKINTKVSLFNKRLIFGKRFDCGKISHRKNFFVLIEKGGKLSIADGCFFNNNCSITCMNSISIGENSIFGESVKIYDHNYHISGNDLPIKSQGHTYGNVSIGKDCWVGSNVVILKNTTIGDHVVIGSGCVINEDIPSNTIVYLDRSNYKMDKINFVN